MYCSWPITRAKEAEDKIMVRVCSLNKNLRDVMSMRQYYFLCEILMVIELNTTTFWLAWLE